MRIHHKDCFLFHIVSNINKGQTVGPYLESIPRFEKKNTFREHTFAPVFGCKVHCFHVGEQRQGPITISVSVMLNIMLQNVATIGCFHPFFCSSVRDLQRNFVRSVMMDSQKCTVSLQGQGLDMVWWQIYSWKHPWHKLFFIKRSVFRQSTIFN